MALNEQVYCPDKALAQRFSIAPTVFFSLRHVISLEHLRNTHLSMLLTQDMWGYAAWLGNSRSFALHGTIVYVVLFPVLRCLFGWVVLLSNLINRNAMILA